MQHQESSQDSRRGRGSKVAPDSPDMSARRASRAEIWLRCGRLFLFVLLVGWIVGGPFYRQVLGGENRYLRRWVMFSGTALGLLDVRYSEQLPNGTRKRVDHVKLLGGKPPKFRKSRARPPWRMKRQERHLLRGYSRRLCRILGPDAKLYLEVRVAVRTGWKQLQRGKKNVCADQPATKKGKAPNMVKVYPGTLRLD